MATENNLQSYELMLIFTPVLAEEDYKNAQKKFQDFIKDGAPERVERIWIDREVEAELRPLVANRPV